MTRPRPRIGHLKGPRRLAGRIRALLARYLSYPHVSCCPRHDAMARGRRIGTGGGW